jgi:hypothetical protein
MEMRAWGICCVDLISVIFTLYVYQLENCFLSAIVANPPARLVRGKSDSTAAGGS